MESWQQLKPEKELEEQVFQAEKALGTELQTNSIDYLPIEEIKQKYPERYNSYLKILRSERNNQGIDESEIKGMREWIQSLNNLDSYITNHEDNSDERILRKRQFTVFEDIRNSFEEGKKEGYIKLPTGVGKTVLFSQVVEALNLKTLIVVPSKILVSQTGEKLEQFTDLEFGNYYQEEKDLSKQVVTITYQSLVRGINEGKINPKDYGALILDEAHKALGEKTQDVINEFDCIKLGFTATPEYSKRKHVSDILEHKIHEMSIIEAVQEGLINRFKSVFAFTETDISEIKINQGGNYNEKDLEKAVNTEGRNLSAIRLYKEMFNGKSAIAYCSGVAHATDITNLFNENGISAAVISGETSPEERNEILARFRSGEIKVLCNARVLIEGFDEPRASVALNLHPTLSKVDAEQRAGRVLRLDKENPDKWAYVVDFIDHSSNHSALSFPEIAEASEASDSGVVKDAELEEKPTQVRNFERTSREKSDINIEGLKIILDTKEILQISKEFETQRYASKETKKWGFEELKNEVQEKGIKSSSEYKKVAAKYGWLNVVTLKNRPEFTTWEEFFGREKFDFKKFQKEVQEKGIKSTEEYGTLSPKYGWLDLGTLKKRPEFTTWDDFFGRESKKGLHLKN